MSPKIIMPVAYSAEAERQTADLAQHYQQRGRIEAIHNLARQLEAAEARITADPEGGLPAPRPYPALARPGRRWLKADTYWISYTSDRPPVILAVFHEAADIPGRL